MSPTLARSVNLHDPETGEYKVYEAGEQVSDAVAKQITNPNAWNDPDNPSPTSGDSELQVTAVSQEEARAGADANATDPKAKGRTNDPDTNETPSDGYGDMRAPELIQLAQDRGVDLQGATKKDDVIARLREADASQQ